MGALDGRVAIITGAGRGIGREHALLFAAEGAKVVVNDLGGANDGTGTDATPAQQVVNEIIAMGGEAVANYDNVADWEGAQHMINAAVEAFGDLDILVNNAGILRDRVLVLKMEVYLKAYFGMINLSCHLQFLGKIQQLLHCSRLKRACEQLQLQSLKLVLLILQFQMQ